MQNIYHNPNIPTLNPTSAQPNQASDLIHHVEWVDIFNSTGKKIAEGTRSVMRAHQLFHQATYLIVHDGLGNILVQKRTANKDFYPNYWDAAAGGVVQANEPILLSAKREASEELGIVDVPFIDHGQFIYQTDSLNVIGYLFSCISKGPFAMQAEEVSAVEWLTVDAIMQQAENFTPDSIVALQKWISR